MYVVRYADVYECRYGGMCVCVHVDLHVCMRDAVGSSQLMYFYSSV